MKRVKKFFKKKRHQVFAFFIFITFCLSLSLLFFFHRKGNIEKFTAEVTVTSPSPSLEPTPSPSPSPTPSPSPSPQSLALSGSFRAFTGSLFTKKISPSATYTKEERIGTIRPSLEAYSHPVYRTTNATLPLVKVVNKYSGRTENWPIPSEIKPATGEDHTASILNFGTKKVYDLWDMQWQGDGSILAGGMKDFSFTGDGLSHPKNQRVTAAGWSALAGMLIAEDFTVGGKLIQTPQINHVIVLSIPHQLIKKDAFISPAQLGESHGDNTGDLPLGVKFALPKETDIDSLKVHPFTKAVARALRDYGAYVSDRNNAGQYKGKYIATMKLETGLMKRVYGKPQDELNPTLQKEMAEIIEKYGLYRVSE